MTRASFLCTGAVIYSFLAASGCTAEKPGSPAAGGTAASALDSAKKTVPPSSRTLTLSFPKGVALGNTVLAADDGVELGRKVAILAADGSGGAIANVGDDPVFIGPESRVGPVTSTDDIRLAEKVTAGALTSSKKVRT
jgi:hypothetical protein